MTRNAHETVIFYSGVINYLINAGDNALEALHGLRDFMTENMRERVLSIYSHYDFMISKGINNTNFPVVSFPLFPSSKKSAWSRLDSRFLISTNLRNMYYSIDDRLFYVDSNSENDLSSKYENIEYSEIVPFEELTNVDFQRLRQSPAKNAIEAIWNSYQIKFNINLGNFNSEYSLAVVSPDFDDLLPPEIKNPVPKSFESNMRIMMSKGRAYNKAQKEAEAILEDKTTDEISKASNIQDIYLKLMKP